MSFPVPFSLGLGTQESTFFPTTYCAQTNTSFLSPFSLQQPALVCSPFPAPHTTRPGFVLVTLCIGDTSTCSYGWLQWLKQNTILSLTLLSVFSAVTALEFNHEPFLLLEVLPHELINSMTGIHHLLQFPIWLAKTSPKISQLRSSILWFNPNCSSGSHFHRLKGKIWCWANARHTGCMSLWVQGMKQLQALSCTPVQSLTFQHGSSSC